MTINSYYDVIDIIKTPQLIYIQSGIIQIGVVQEKLQKYWYNIGGKH